MCLPDQKGDRGLDMEQQGSEHELTAAEDASWSAGWDEIHERIRPRFAQSEKRQWVRRSVEGLLGRRAGYAMASLS
jgi:hypothetical protein